MEKLQAALQKARKERAQSAGVTTERRVEDSARAVGGKASRLAARWAELAELEVPQPVLERNRIVTRAAGPAAGPFDVLRTKILVQMRKNGWKRLAITSPMPQSGKTTTACNLALGFGRQKELRSVLLDTDLRGPSVNKFFETDVQHGIGEVLSGKASFAEQALRIGDNVAVSMAREADKDPTRLLLADETAEVIDKIEADYQPDVMIFDLPSILINDDTRAFLKNVDCALIVIRANVTRYSQFDTCEREIADQTNVLGVVLNAYRHYARGH